MIIVVIPTYNESGNIDELVKQLTESLRCFAYQILFIDDNSPDGTAAKIESLRHPQIAVLRRERKEGLGSAYRFGFKEALKRRAELVVQMDADLSHDPSVIPQMIVASKDADLVIGSRYIKGGEIMGWNWWRRFCSNGAIWFSRLLLSIPTKDITAGYRLWQSDLLQIILDQDIQSEGYAFQEEMLFQAHRLKARIKEIPITFKDRKIGQSKLGYKQVREFFAVIIQLWRKYGRL